MEIEKEFDHTKVEPRWAKWWVENNIYKADPSAPSSRFSIVIPPPSVNGSLHMGHMLEHSIIDATVRWRRMRGHNTLWLPGTDHAGNATQVLVERKLGSEGTSRTQLGREGFENRIWQWTEQYSSRIIDQMKRIGDSVDWSREKFTLSPDLSQAVTEAFVRLYLRGLIYRGTSMVNWCPQCQTVISDLETLAELIQGHMYQIRFKITGTVGFLTVTATKLEAMLGITAVAIHPNDDRYFHLHGRTVTVPLLGRHIPIVVDERADPTFGSGALGLMPAHSPNDFEIGKHHKLPIIEVIDRQGQMSPAAGRYAGMDRFTAREQIQAALETQGLLVNVEAHTLPIRRCDRCKTIIEPLASTQWFVRTGPLAEKALAAVNAGHIRFVPEHWTDSCTRWMENVGDWCISRQLWWGHRIPAWHCQNCFNITVARSTPGNCSYCGEGPLEQDPDVLDTWFSAGLWPFASLGWPEDTEDLKAYYPTSLLITGCEIVFFWVARMILLGLELTGQQPFRVVHIHGLVRDANGDKMSKTKGNVIDPLDIINRFGTDAARMALTMGVATGTDVVFNEDRLVAARHFTDKIWNTARLLLMEMETCGVEPNVFEPGLLESAEDRWIFGRLQKTLNSVNRSFENHRYDEVSDSLWQFFVHDLCDGYLDVKKFRLTGSKGLTNGWRNTLAVFGAALRMLHPLMPFITEELWRRLGREDSISLQPYPTDFPIDEDADREMALLKIPRPADQRPSA